MVDNIVDGSWGAWMIHQACSANCSIGYEVVKRECNFPPPSGGLKCLTTNNTRELEEIKTQQCNTHPCGKRFISFILYCF
jgi:hypothetical protein